MAIVVGITDDDIVVTGSVPGELITMEDLLSDPLVIRPNVSTRNGFTVIFQLNLVIKCRFDATFYSISFVDGRGIIWQGLECTYISGNLNEGVTTGGGEIGTGNMAANFQAVNPDPTSAYTSYEDAPNGATTIGAPTLILNGTVFKSNANTNAGFGIRNPNQASGAFNNVTVVYSPREDDITGINNFIFDLHPSLRASIVMENLPLRIEANGSALNATLIRSSSAADDLYEDVDIEVIADSGTPMVSLGNITPITGTNGEIKLVQTGTSSAPVDVNIVNPNFDLSELLLGGIPSISVSQTLDVVLRIPSLPAILGQPGDVVFGARQAIGNFTYEYEPISQPVVEALETIQPFLSNVFIASNLPGHGPVPTIPDGPTADRRNCVLTTRRYGYLTSQVGVDLLDQDQRNVGIQLLIDSAITIPAADVNRAGITIDPDGGITVANRVDTTFEEIYAVYALEYTTVELIGSRSSLANATGGFFFVADEITISAASNREADTVVIGAAPNLSLFSSTNITVGENCFLGFFVSYFNSDNDFIRSLAVPMTSSTSAYVNNSEDGVLVLSGTPRGISNGAMFFEGSAVSTFDIRLVEPNGALEVISTTAANFGTLIVRSTQIILGLESLTAAGLEAARTSRVGTYTFDSATTTLTIDAGGATSLEDIATYFQTLIYDDPNLFDEHPFEFANFNFVFEDLNFIATGDTHIDQPGGQASLNSFSAENGSTNIVISTPGSVTVTVNVQGSITNLTYYVYDVTNSLMQSLNKSISDSSFIFTIDRDTEFNLVVHSVGYRPLFVNRTSAESPISITEILQSEESGNTDLDIVSLLDRVNVIRDVVNNTIVLLLGNASGDFEPDRQQTRAIFSHVKSTVEYLTFLVSGTFGEVITISNSVIRIASASITVQRSTALLISSEVRLSTVLLSTADHEVTVVDSNSKRVITDSTPVEADSSLIASQVASGVQGSLGSLILQFNNA